LSYNDVKARYDQWHKRGECETGKLYDVHFFRRLGKKVETPTHKTVVDIGCGTGSWLRFMHDLGPSIQCVGLDISVQALKVALEESPFVDYVCAVAEYSPFSDNAFDYLFCLGSLEHFPDKVKAAREIARVLREESLAYVFLPNLYFLGHIYLVLRTGEPPDEGLQHFSESFDTSRGWGRLLSSAGLDVKKLHKYNRISSASTRVSRFTRRLYNMLIAPLLPLNLSYGFLYVCKKSKQN